MNVHDCTLYLVSLCILYVNYTVVVVVSCSCSKKVMVSKQVRTTFTYLLRSTFILVYCTDHFRS